MNEITVDPQEVVVWLAFSDGWKKASGFVVTIQGVKFSFVPYDQKHPKVLISELSSGAKCVEIDFSIIDFINSSTKEGTIQVFSEYATKFSECIDSNLRKQIITQSARQKKEHESKFGKIPEVVPFDLEGWAGEDCELIQYPGLKDSHGKDVCEGDMFQKSLKNGAIIMR